MSSLVVPDNFTCGLRAGIWGCVCEYDCVAKAHSDIARAMASPFAVMSWCFISDWKKIVLIDVCTEIIIFVRFYILDFQNGIKVSVFFC